MWDFFRSQSTNNVRAPVIAINLAIEIAVVDLPSSGIEEVIPMIRPVATEGLRSMATLMARIASA